jgi:CRISPR-associated protein Cas1
MKRHLNTLFVTTQGAYLHRDNDNIVVSVDREERLRLPVHNLGSIICFGRVLCTPSLLGHCAENGVAVSFLSEHGRFLARVDGPAHGNVLVRRRQYRMSDDQACTTEIARWIVSAKLTNARSQLVRQIRERALPQDSQVGVASRRLRVILKSVSSAGDVDAIRGHEGEAARVYFSCFDSLIRSEDPRFRFESRSRRPPLNRVNALLSFIYTILLHDVQSATDAVGLDPAVGYLHRDRPGRPGLALDLMEEFRPWLADRLAAALINRNQISADDFETVESGAVMLDESGRKTLLTAYQNRKQEETYHPFLDEKVTIGSLFFVQALLLARFVRGEIDAYPPFMPR